MFALGALGGVVLVSILAAIRFGKWRYVIRVVALYWITWIAAEAIAASGVVA